MRILPEEMYADIINPGECFPKMSSFFYENGLEISRWLGARFPDYMYTLNLEKEFGLINWRVIAIRKSPEYFLKYNRTGRIFLLEKNHTQILIGEDGVFNGKEYVDITNEDMKYSKVWEEFFKE